VKLVRTVDAVGHVLCHDLTRIVRGEGKGPAFRKGHVVSAEDIPMLLSMGKENLYVWESKPGFFHENDAAKILGELCMGAGTRPAGDIREGKLDIFAEIDGVFIADDDRLSRVNGIEEIVIATRHGNFPVKSGEKLAGARVVPLVIDGAKLDVAKKIVGGEPLLSVRPFTLKKAAVLTTGSEVFHGRIADTFTPVIREKLAEYGVEIVAHETVGDDSDSIARIVTGFADSGAELIVCTGGMSVDPDDTTPLGIRKSGAQIVSYGAPVLPGSMFLLAYLRGSIPVLGLPGCVMYSRRTIFDLVLPRILAGVAILREDLTRLGQGGLCLDCETCAYPNCGFGK